MGVLGKTAPATKVEAGAGMPTKSAIPSHVGLQDADSTNQGAGKRVLVLDVDGTLYAKDAGIEQQIVHHIHRFCQRKFELTPQQCEELYSDYGSTIQGLKAAHGLTDGGQEEFYFEVYNGIDYTALLKPHENGDQTGFKHASNLRRLLRNANTRIYIASNSPLRHVKKVLAHLGLADIGWAGFLTPDTRGWLVKTEPPFYDELLAQFPPSEGYQIELIDDSEANLATARSLAMRGTLCTSQRDLEQSVMSHLGIIPRPSKWKFDAIRYIKSKNVIDTNSFSENVLSELDQQVQDLGVKEKLKVVDLGAGLLSMLDQVIRLPGNHKGVDYFALETEKELVEENRKMLEERGFTVVEGAAVDGMFRFENKDLGCQVTLLEKDFRSLPPRLFGDVHLFVACCFTDLLDPQELLTSLMLLAGSQSKPLLYAPITFCGSTSLRPEQPKEGSVPADSLVLEAYHASLKDVQGHHLDPRHLISTVKAYGGKLLSRGTSDWTITPPGDEEMREKSSVQDLQDAEIYSDDARMWATMLYFLGSGTAAAMEPGWDMGSWIARAKRVRPTIVAANVDLLFQLFDCEGETQQGEVIAAETGACTPAWGGREDVVKEGEQMLLEFVSTRTVQTRSAKQPPPGPGQLLLKSVSSVVSSGTELKVFRGEFETDSQLDTTIKGMADKTMSYPLTYGYSLVGRVVAVGKGVEAGAYIGKLVFAFAPHGSHAVIDAEGAMLVPEGIAAEDACYLPAVETALSLVQDASPIVGENIAVYGQGMIGLLVTAILSRTFGPDKVFAVEMNPDRAAASRRIGAGSVIHPTALKKGNSALQDIDLSIEVSGNARALQAAIDNTASNGRLILGSWYGSKAAELTLGLDFHRSALSIKCSQVSKIPAALTGRWDKPRRFRETWEWVRRLRPSEHLSTMTLPLKSAQQGYELLDTGETLGVQFAYPP